MKTRTIKTIKEKGVSLDYIIENVIDHGKQWAELGFFECDEFENGHYYYFSNYYGSEGAYFNEENGAFYTSGELEDYEYHGLSEEEAEEIQNSWDWEFCEVPIDWEIVPTVVKDTHSLSTIDEYVIKDEEGRSYGEGSGIYQYFDGQFYPIEIIEMDEEMCSGILSVLGKSATGYDLSTGSEWDGSGAKNVEFKVPTDLQKAIKTLFIIGEKESSCGYGIEWDYDCSIGDVAEMVYGYYYNDNSFNPELLVEMIKNYKEMNNVA